MSIAPPTTLRPWAQLFARSAGFHGTELFVSASTPGRYLTVDRFSDEASWVEFLTANRAAYDALDRRLRSLTRVESELS